MKAYILSLFIALFSLTSMLSGCTTTPDMQVIKELPPNATEIMTSDITGQNGTYTEGSIYVSGNGSILFDVQLQSGSIKELAIKEATTNEDVYTINKPQTNLYYSDLYEYKADAEYKLSFVDSKEPHGSITVYFVAE